MSSESGLHELFPREYKAARNLLKQGLISKAEGWGNWIKLTPKGEEAYLRTRKESVEVGLNEEEKWMQKAVDPKKKGELHTKLGIPQDETIPMSTLTAKKKELQKKGEGDKKLSAADKETLSQIQFAINAKRAKK